MCLKYQFENRNKKQKQLNISESSNMRFKIHFWTSAEIINQTHLNDFGQIFEYKMYDEARAHRFFQKAVPYFITVCNTDPVQLLHMFIMEDASACKSYKGMDWFPKVVITSALDRFRLKTSSLSHSINIVNEMNCLCAGSTLNPFIFLVSPFFIIGKGLRNETCSALLSPEYTRWTSKWPKKAVTETVHVIRTPKWPI